MACIEVVGPHRRAAGLLGFDEGISLRLQSVERVRQPTADNRLPLAEVGDHDAEQHNGCGVEDGAWGRHRVRGHHVGVAKAGADRGDNAWAGAAEQRDDGDGGEAEGERRALEGASVQAEHCPQPWKDNRGEVPEGKRKGVGQTSELPCCGLRLHEPPWQSLLCVTT